MLRISCQGPKVGRYVWPFLNLGCLGRSPIGREVQRLAKSAAANIKRHVVYASQHNVWLSAVSDHNSVQHRHQRLLSVLIRREQQSQSQSQLQTILVYVTKGRTSTSGCLTMPAFK